MGAGAAQRGPGDPGRNELIEWLHTVERGNDCVVYQTDAQDTSWSRLCLSQADVALLTGGAGGDPRLGEVEARALAMNLLRCELVLVHPSQPSATSRWLEGRAVADHHHLRADHPEDAARLARMVTGNACGVVLGGGSSRGFAHLGVLRALEEAGVPIDVVGGTSVGAVMGALCASGLSDAERVERAVTAFTRSGRFITLTLPLIALSSGRRVNRLLEEHIGSTPIEDLPRPFFCVSANLTRAEEVIHARGPLWRAVRASLSLPGIFPPIYADGDLLVDGAALNNVPAEVMRARIGSGSIVAVDLFPDVEPMTAAPFDSDLSGWRVLGRRLNPLRRPAAAPAAPRYRRPGLQGRCLPGRGRLPAYRRGASTVGAGQAFHGVSAAASLSPSAGGPKYQVGRCFRDSPCPICPLGCPAGGGPMSSQARPGEAGAEASAGADRQMQVVLTPELRDRLH
jgi:NTE family protein/lysophospholipid hydrolase